MNPFAPAAPSAPSEMESPLVVWAHLALMFVAAFGLFLLYRWAMRRLRRHFVRHRYSEERALQLEFGWRYGYLSVSALILIAAFGESLSVIGLSLAFVGTLLGWALQPYVANLAAWMLLIRVKPYRIGDRVILGGTIGDVKDIDVFYTALDQVGGTIAGEEKSGRTLLVANQNLFHWTLVNYRLNEPYILDEVAVRVRHDSDLERAEALLIECAREVLGGLVRETDCEPYVRHELIPSCAVSRVRYKVPPENRQEIAAALSARIFERVKAEPAVDFAYIQHVNHVRRKDSSQTLPPHDPYWFQAIVKRTPPPDVPGGA